jgi:hypothetical protein
VGGEGLAEGQRVSWRERVSNSSHWGDGKVYHLREEWIGEFRNMAHHK